MLAHLINRLRLLRKKRSRITKIEDGLAQGKLLNSDQEEILRSKPVVLALIQELEDLRAVSVVPAPAVASEVPEKPSQDVAALVPVLESVAAPVQVDAAPKDPQEQENVQEVSKENPDQFIAVEESPKFASEQLEQSLVEASQEAGEKPQNLENGEQKESLEEVWHVQRRPFQVIRDRKKFNDDGYDSRRGYGGVYPNGSRGVQGQYNRAGNYVRNDAFRGDQRGRGEYSNGQGQHYNTRNYHSSDGNVGRGGYGGQRGRGGYSNGQGQLHDTGSNQSSDGNVARAGVGAQHGRGGNSNGEGQHYQRRTQNGGSTRGRGSGRGGGHNNDVSVPVAEQV